ncbi:hypothetical protein [Aeromonas salmonicida]
MKTKSMSYRVVTIIAGFTASSMAIAAPAILVTDPEDITLTFNTTVTLDHTLNAEFSGIFDAGNMLEGVKLASGVINTDGTFTALSFPTTPDQAAIQGACNRAVVSGSNNPVDNKLSIYFGYSGNGNCRPFTNEERFVLEENLTPGTIQNYSYSILKGGTSPVAADSYKVSVNAVSFVY